MEGLPAADAAAEAAEAAPSAALGCCGGRGTLQKLAVMLTQAGVTYGP